MLRVIIATFAAGILLVGSEAARPRVSPQRPATAKKAFVGVDKVFSCPASVGTFPHETYCNLYYECHEYTAYIFTCPYDWLFSPQLSLCDFPDNVNCNGLGISTTGPGGLTTELTPKTTWGPLVTGTDGVTTDRWQVSTIRPTTGPFTCPSQDGDYANPDDCSTYFSCFAGESTLLHCPGGTNFNPTTGWCEVGTDFCSSGGFTEDPNQSPDPTRTTKTTPKPFTCAEDGLYPNTGDCSTYYSCSGGNAFLMDCPPGTNFNPSTDTCEIGDSFCTRNRNLVRQDEDSSSTTKLPDVTPSTWFVCPEPEGYFVSPYNCSVYFQCTNNLPWEAVCSAGLWFDVSSERCNWPDQVDCTANPTGFKSNQNLLHGEREDVSVDPTVVDEVTVDPTTVLGEVTVVDEATTVVPEEVTTNGAGTTSEPPVTPVNWFQCHEDGTFSNPYDCHTFIICVFGNGWLQHCSPSTYIFDPEAGRCVAPGQASCSESTGTPTPRTPPPNYTVDPGFVCDGDGLYPYEQNCHFYYQCANGTPYLQECSTGLVFYPPKKRCATLSEVDLDQLACQLHDGKKESNLVDRLRNVVAKDSARLSAMKASESRHYRQQGWFATKKNLVKAQISRPKETRASARHDGAQVHRILRASIEK